VPSPDPLALTQQLVAVLDEGRRTATYKLAVLLALIDCSGAQTDERGRAGASIPTRDLARRVIELYWPQVRPYSVDESTSSVLRQSSQARAVTVDAVAALRARAEATGVMTVALVERSMPDDLRMCLDEVELNLVQMPLGKLQRPAGWTERSSTPYPRFLYDDSAFHADVTTTQLRTRPFAVQLHDGVADVLVSLGGLLRPLLELHWTRDVARYNRRDLGEDRLREFLFGATRISLRVLGPPLREAQQDACFYCRGRLDTSVDVDHFLPWSRVPNDALANLVLAHRACNNAKRDNLAALTHLHRWATRPEDVLRQVADDLGWAVEHGRSLRLARGIYAHERAGAMLWVQPGVFEVLDDDRLAALLPLLDAT
jgi:5-methylcytosine-specific restriction endonuclease McrA